MTYKIFSIVYVCAHTHKARKDGTRLNKFLGCYGKSRVKDRKRKVSYLGLVMVARTNQGLPAEVNNKVGYYCVVAPVAHHPTSIYV